MHKIAAAMLTFIAASGFLPPVAAEPLTQPLAQMATSPSPTIPMWTGSFASATAQPRAFGPSTLLRTVPEPSSLLLVLVGLLAVALTRRRSLRRWDGALRRRASAARARLAEIMRAIPRRAARRRDPRARGSGARAARPTASSLGLHDIDVTRPPQQIH